MNQQVIETGKLASVGELAAGIAHEINNPVAIMVEEAGWLLDLMEDQAYKKESDLAEFERALNQIRTQGKRCKEITHKLLSFARKTDSRIEDFEIGPLVEEVVSLSVQRAKYSNVELITHLEPMLPAISASHSELQQVFLNLINNALYAMEKTGGTVEISARQEDRQIVIEDDHVKAELKKLKEELRKLRRKNEHNRRAYIITQLQLDLAHFARQDIGDILPAQQAADVPPVVDAWLQAQEQVDGYNKDHIVERAPHPRSK